MNWEAGILAFVLLYIPMIFLFIWFNKKDREIEQEYRDKLAEIKKKYGVEQ